MAVQETLWIRRDTLEEIKEVLVEEAAITVVGLWAVHWDVKHQLPGLSAHEARSATLCVVHDVIREGRVVAGRLVARAAGKPTFVPWSNDADEVVARIREAWSSLEHEPNLGDIVDLVSPALVR
jgi:hypothetical protein